MFELYTGDLLAIVITTVHCTILVGIVRMWSVNCLHYYCPLHNPCLKCLSELLTVVITIGWLDWFDFIAA